MSIRQSFIIFILIFTLNSCKTTSYFASPNYLADKDCKLVLLDGTEKPGKLTIQFETGHDANNSVILKSSNNVVEKILIDSIQFYQIGKEVFYPKEINLESYEIPYKDNLYLPGAKNILFVKALTDQNAKISLFELFQPKTKTSDGFDHYDYFLSIRNQPRLMATDLGNKLFFPNFSEKMSNIVSDCPSLSEKIKAKEKGYSLSQISVDMKRLEVFKKIIAEYNNCK